MEILLLCLPKRSFLLKLFFLLTVVYPFSLHATSLCSDLFSKESYAGPRSLLSGEEPPYEYPLPTQTPPEIHTFNFQIRMSSYLNQGKVESKIVGEPLREWACLLPSLCFFIESVSQSIAVSDVYILRDVLGNRFRINGRRQTGSLEINFQSLEKIESHDSINANSVQTLRNKSQSSSLRLAMANELAKTLTDMQLSTSKNAKEAESDVFGKAILKANKILAETLVEHKQLTVETLEKINFFANQGRLVAGGRVVMGIDRNAPMAGVMRGTSNRVTLNKNRLVLVNMSEIEVSQSGQLNSFLPAKEVPLAMQSLVTRMNDVGPNTSLDAIFSLYREFILIHPFADANGRTGRMLLNYLLLRADLPPMNVPSESLYFNPIELANQYLKLAGATQ